MNAHIVGSVAEYESEHKSERIRRKLEANAADGLHHGGSRPYGWLDDRQTLDPTEAAAVIEATDRVLAGESVKGIARELNAAGYRTSTGRPWRDVTVREMLLRPRNAGLRLHHGEVVGHGQWTPILPADRFHQVEAILNNPARRTHPGKDGRVHLLSVLARCGVCDGPIVVAKSKPYKGISKPVYRCRSAHVIRDQAAVDDLVTRVIIGHLGLPDAAALLVEPDRADEAAAAKGHVQELQDRLNDAAQAYAAGTVTLAQLTTINAAVRRTSTRLRSPPRLPAGPGYRRPRRDRPGGGVEQMTPHRRRAVVDLLVEVRIMPTGKGPRFAPESVRIDWKRTGAGELAMTARRTHRRIGIPIITVYCDDAIHADIAAQVVARFANYPPGGGWGSRDGRCCRTSTKTSSTTRTHRSPAQVRRRGRHNRRAHALQRQVLEVRPAGKAKAGNRSRLAEDKLQSVCELLAGAGEFAPTLTAFAAIVRRSAGREH